MGSKSKADHLCVMMHGLWGQPEHLNHLKETLLNEYGEDKIRILTCASNSGNFTYDGIDVCAERAAQEIQDYLQDLGEEAKTITKFSMVGYSLGGVMARYVIGVLDHDGFFDTYTPVNFTTFATPHLGARAPLGLWTSHVFNTLGPRMLSASGQQVFVMDNFRNTGKPLLELMTEPDSIFMHALSKFKKRTLYANVINDRLCHFYTASMSTADPYAGKPENLDLTFVDGMAPVLIDPTMPISLLDQSHQEEEPWMDKLKLGTKRVGYVAFFSMVFPIFFTGLVTNSLIQSYQSRNRIELHNKTYAKGADFNYKMMNMLQRTASSVNGAVPTLRSMSSSHGASLPKSTQSTTTTTSEKADLTAKSFPPLSILPSQRSMISSIDANAPFEKFHVWIHKTRWSHAAIVVRKPNPVFEEGRSVVRHWVERQFIL